MEKAKSLILFFFETGDASCQYYTVDTVAESVKGISAVGLERRFRDYLAETGILYAPGLEYEDRVAKFMEELGFTWSFLGDTVPECRRIFALFA